MNISNYLNFRILATANWIPFIQLYYSDNVTRHSQESRWWIVCNPFTTRTLFLSAISRPTPLSDTFPLSLAYSSRDIVISFSWKLSVETVDTGKSIAEFKNLWKWNVSKKSLVTNSSGEFTKTNLKRYEWQKVIPSTPLNLNKI